MHNIFATFISGYTVQKVLKLVKIWEVSQIIWEVSQIQTAPFYALQQVSFSLIFTK